MNNSNSKDKLSTTAKRQLFSNSTENDDKISDLKSSSESSDSSSDDNSNHTHSTTDISHNTQPSLIDNDDIPIRSNKVEIFNDQIESRKTSHRSSYASRSSLPLLSVSPQTITIKKKKKKDDLTGFLKSLDNWYSSGKQESQKSLLEKLNKQNEKESKENLVWKTLLSQEIRHAEEDFSQEFRQFDSLLQTQTNSEIGWGKQWQEKFEKVMDEQALEVDQERRQLQQKLKMESFQLNKQLRSVHEFETRQIELQKQHEDELAKQVEKERKLLKEKIANNVKQNNNDDKFKNSDADNDIDDDIDDDDDDDDDEYLSLSEDNEVLFEEFEKLL